MFDQRPVKFLDTALWKFRPKRQEDIVKFRFKGPSGFRI